MKNKQLPPQKKYSRRLAFTLAETLITLAIIGVVAAMTIPTLISKYQKHTYVVGLKKAYATLSNAMAMIPISEGCMIGDYKCAGFYDINSIDGQDFGNYRSNKAAYLLSKQLKTKKLCYYKNLSTIRPCHPTFGGDSGAALITTDEMAYYIYNPVDREEWNRSYIDVDVNGKKGPNKLGRDIFRFLYVLTERNGIKKGTIIPSGSKLNYNYAGSGWYNHYWKNEKENDPSDDYCRADTYDYRCAGRVLEEDAMNY